MKKEGRKKPVFFVLALFDAGIGEAQINTILSAINVPTVTWALLKRYERIVGSAIEAVALESCQESVREEIALTKVHNNLKAE